MTHSEPERRASRPVLETWVSGLLVVAAIGAVLSVNRFVSSFSAAASPSAAIRTDGGGALRESDVVVPGGTLVLRLERRGALGEADGVVPDGTTVFDGETPGVANLDRSLLEALRRAATDAARDGIEFQVNSGWRSAAYQERLLHQAVAEYGSEVEAARWVGTPTTSAHVSGDAVDIGPFAATAWLSEHGPRYGLCQIYRNEPWHFELRPEAIDSGCPPMYLDPTHDPRMWP